VILGCFHEELNRRAPSLLCAPPLKGVALALSLPRKRERGGTSRPAVCSASPRVRGKVEVGRRVVGKQARTYNVGTRPNPSPARALCNLPDSSMTCEGMDAPPLSRLRGRVAATAAGRGPSHSTSTRNDLDTKNEE
jgi:hypothetical protein